MENASLKKIEQAILGFEQKHLFLPAWYSILFNPYFISRSHLRDKIRAFATSLGGSKRILDVGCGSKPYASYFASHEYVGLEVEVSGHRDSDKKADFYFDGTSIPFDDGIFDIVMSSQVLEHAEHIDVLLAEIRRVLRPGGLFFITMPFAWPEHEEPYDFRRYTRFGHWQQLEKSGFESISLQSTSGAFGTTGQLLSDFLMKDVVAMCEVVPSEYRYRVRFVVERLCAFVLCFPIQLIALSFDALFLKKGITLDYVILSVKK